MLGRCVGLVRPVVDRWEVSVRVRVRVDNWLLLCILLRLVCRNCCIDRDETDDVDES